MNSAADMYRDLTDAEIIALAEDNGVTLIGPRRKGTWAWTKSGRDSIPGPFLSKLDAADDAVCALGLDQQDA